MKTKAVNANISFQPQSLCLDQVNPSNITSTSSTTTPFTVIKLTSLYHFGNDSFLGAHGSLMLSHNTLCLNCSSRNITATLQLFDRPAVISICCLQSSHSQRSPSKNPMSRLPLPLHSRRQ